MLMSMLSPDAAAGNPRFDDDPGKSSPRVGKPLPRRRAPSLPAAGRSSRSRGYTWRIEEHNPSWVRLETPALRRIGWLSGAQLEFLPALPGAGPQPAGLADEQN